MKIKKLKSWQKKLIDKEKTKNSIETKKVSNNKVKIPIPAEDKYKAIVYYNHFLHSLRKVGKLYGIPKSTLHRYVQNNPSFKKIKKPRKVKEIKASIKSCINKALVSNPLITMESLTKLISQECKLNHSIKTINRYVKKLGYSYKDAYQQINYKHDNQKIKEFCLNFKMAHESNVLISIDEAGFYVGDHRRKGWSLKGQKLLINGGKNLNRTKFTIITAIGIDGIVDYDILDSNCKKQDFVAFIKKLKAPSGAILLMDNLRCHHSWETINAAENKGYDILYTPPYSPKLNPIENVFGTIKPEYRKRCPIAHVDASSYKDIFQMVINEFENRSLERFFNHTLKIVMETLRAIELNPETFIFMGYDV